MLSIIKRESIYQSDSGIFRLQLKLCEDVVKRRFDYDNRHKYKIKIIRARAIVCGNTKSRKIYHDFKCHTTFWSVFVFNFFL